jgi:tetratricopeptide (TPR) repeat protein
MREAAIRWRGVLLGVLLGAGIAGVGDLARAAEAGCQAWPGEPDPLPQVTSDDALLARWSLLRASELAQAALQAEPVAPGDAWRIWAHLLCLDPENREARAALERARPLRVHRLGALASETQPEPGPRLPLPQAFAALDEPVAVWVPPPPRPVARRADVTPPPALAPVADASPEPEAGLARAPAIPATADEAIAEAEAALRSARYADAVAAAGRARERLAPLSASPAVLEQRARVEVTSATALLALGRADAAREAFLRALAARPELALDPRTTSPKVLQAFESARASAGGPP